MKLYFVNTDQRRQSPGEWIRLGVAVTTADEKNRELMSRIEAGDGILAYENRTGVVAYGEALAGAVREVRDSAQMVNKQERVEYHVPVRWLLDLREQPLSHDDLRRSTGVQPRHPCQEVHQGKEWVLEWVRTARSTALYEQALQQHQQFLQQDLDAIRKDRSRGATTREALVEARVGQGRFRASLLQEFSGRCAATGLALPPALRASHILAWRHADDEQRLDHHNGLLLSANFDALFDLALITFDEAGVLHASELIPREQKAALGLGDLQAAPNAKRAAYLREHNARFRELEEGRTNAAACVVCSATHATR